MNKKTPYLSIVVLLTLLLSSIAAPTAAREGHTHTPPPAITVQTLPQPLRLPSANRPHGERARPATQRPAPLAAASPAAPGNGSCSVLLVDDDWDQYLGEPFNGSGTAYYTSTLDALGYPYDRWDTWTQGEPSLTLLQSYDAIVWFTGYAYSETITPNEDDLAAYLDGGGNLFFSGEDYIYDLMDSQGQLSNFARRYLGIENAAEDWGDTDPVGNAGDPVGSGLGPYNLTIPSSWPADDPTLWTDRTFETASAGAPFRYQASGYNGSTSVLSNTFKTVFLAWPLEGLASLNDRVAVLGSALDWFCNPPISLLPAAQTSFADAGSTAAYTLTLTHRLISTQTFSFTYDSAWNISGPATVGPLAPNSSQTFHVTVTVPVTAGCTGTNQATVTAWDATFAYSATALIGTIAGRDWEAESNSGAAPAYWAASTCTDDYGAAGTCFAVGGIDDTTFPTGRAQMFDIASSTWSTFTDAPLPVFGATLGYIDGKLYLAGGYTDIVGDWGGTYALQIYDLSSGSWSFGPSITATEMLTGAGGSAGAVLDGWLHVTGGCGANDCASNRHVAFDPATNRWIDLAPLPAPRIFHAAAADAGRLYVGGDYNGDGSFWAYDPASDTWTAMASLPANAGRMSPVAATTPEGLFWWGGAQAYWSNLRPETWQWDPVVNRWNMLSATLGQIAAGAGGGAVGGRLWTFGGSDGLGALIPPPHESLIPCTPPTPPHGWLTGHVYDANTSAPLENALVVVEDANDPDWNATRYTAANGAYRFEHAFVTGVYTLTVDAFGYNRHTAAVTVTEGVTTSLAISLTASQPRLLPAAVSVTATLGSTTTMALNLANDGTGRLTFHLTELGAPMPLPQPPPLPRGVDPRLRAALMAAPGTTGRFIVYMADQADLSAAFAMEDWSARGRYVLETLRAQAERSQAELRAELDRAGIPSESRPIANALVVEANLKTANWIAARPDVAFVGPDLATPAPQAVATASLTVPGGVEWNISKVKANSVWNLGYRGQGIVVASIDTGVAYTHPALDNQYRGNLGGTFDHNHNWWDPYGYSPAQPVDWSSHGSHTMGIMVGSDGSNQIGMAPEARWIACMGFDPATGLGYDAELLECADFMLAPWDLNGENPNPDLRPHIVNNSWGGGQAQWWYNQAVYAWQAAGILPVFAAGNDGPLCATATDPGDMVNALAVGAVDSADSNAPASPASFSSRGPAAISGAVKPDIVAPGDWIRSATSSGGYGYMGGTSQAAPHVAGQAALLWSAQPQLIGQVSLTGWLIEQTAVPLAVNQGYLCGDDASVNSRPNNQYGWGRIDALAAVNMARNNAWDVPWLTVEPTSGVVAPGEAVSITLGFDPSGLTPGECYTATLWAGYNAPYPHEDIPVTMCVEGPSLTLEKKVVPAVCRVGEPVTYTLTLGNGGNLGASGVVVTDTLPAGVELAWADPPGAYVSATHELLWTALSVGAGEQLTVTLVVTVGAQVTPGTWLTNHVYLDHATLEQPLSAQAALYVDWRRLYLPVVRRN